MGLNVYTLDKVHIGKRTADGVWCWNCRVRAKIIEDPMDSKKFFWYCPKCGQKGCNETLYSPVARELGFDESNPRKHIGIDGANGFIWQVGEFGLGNTIDEIKKNIKKRKYVKTEHGDKWTIEKFQDMLKDVLIEETSTQDFS